MNEEREMFAPSVPPPDEPQLETKTTPAPAHYLVERAIVAREALLQAEFEREARQAARITELEAEVAKLRDKLRSAGVCMACVDGAPEPYGCTDCLNTGWDGGTPIEVQKLEAANAKLREAILRLLRAPTWHDQDPKDMDNEDRDAERNARAALAQEIRPSDSGE